MGAEMKEGPYGARKPHEPSRMRTGPDVTVQDVLDALVGRTTAPSNMGAQLDRIRDKAFRIPDKTQAKNLIEEDQNERPVQKARRSVRDISCIDSAETFALMRAPVLHCIQDLCEVGHAHSLKSRAALAALHKQAPHWTQGALVVGCLRAYHEWASHSKERALAEVCAWLHRVAGAEAPDAFELAQHFREGKAKRSRTRAAELYADCILVLLGWVGIWNRREISQRNT